MVKEVLRDIVSTTLDPYRLLVALIPTLAEQNNFNTLQLLQSLITAASSDENPLLNPPKSSSSSQTKQQKSKDTKTEKVTKTESKDANLSEERKVSSLPLYHKEGGSQKQRLSKKSSSVDSLSSLIFSRRYLDKIIEDMKEANNGANLLNQKYFSANFMINWMKKEADYNTTDATQIAQQLLDVKLLLPVDPSQRVFRKDRFMFFMYESESTTTSQQHQQVNASLDLSSVLKNEKTCIEFSIYLEQSTNAHLLSFWLEVELLKANSNLARSVDTLCSLYVDADSVFHLSKVLDKNLQQSVSTLEESQKKELILSLQSKVSETLQSAFLR